MPCFLLKKYAQYTLFFIFVKSAYCAYNDEIVAFDFMFFCQKYANTHFLPSKSFFIYSVVFFSNLEKVRIVRLVCIISCSSAYFLRIVAYYCVILCNICLFLLTWLTWLTWLVLGGALPPPKPPIGLLPKPACGA